MKKMRNCLLMLSVVLVVIPEVWINDKPLYLSYNGHHYFPLLVEPSVEDFGQQGMVSVDFKNLNSEKVHSVVWPLVAWGVNESDSTLSSYPSPPSFSHLLGTDDRGRDLLGRLIYALRLSLIFSFVTVLVLILISLFVGTVAGLFSGWFDFLVQVMMDIFESIPQFVIFLLASVYWGQSPFVLGCLFIFFNWTSLATIARSQVLNLWKTPFIEASLAAGASRWEVLWRHVFRHTIPSQWALAPKLMIQLILVQVSMGFLGFGFQAPSADLGEILYQSETYLESSWWLIVYPCLLVTALLAVLLRCQVPKSGHNASQR